MTRLFTITALLLGLAAFGQQPQLPAPGEATEQQKCQMKCGEAMNACMMPCTGGNPDEAAKPENRNKMMGCMKKCADTQQPCMKACEKKKK